MRLPVRILNRGEAQVGHASGCRDAIDEELLLVGFHAASLRLAVYSVKCRLPHCHNPLALKLAVGVLTGRPWRFLVERLLGNC